jgi:hypothetical protein
MASEVTPKVEITGEDVDIVRAMNPEFNKQLLIAAAARVRAEEQAKKSYASSQKGKKS